MKRVHLIAIVIASMFFHSFVANGAEKFEENRSIKDFNSISLSISAEVYLSQRDKFSVQIISNSDDIIKEIKTTVSKGTLKIFVENPSRLWKQSGLQIKIFITMPDIEKLNIAGSGTIRAKKIVSDNISLSVAGSGCIWINDLTTEIVETRVAGSGIITFENLSAKILSANVAGSGIIKMASDKIIDDCTLSVAGSGIIKAKNLKAHAATATVTGSGYIGIDVSQQLTAKVTGSGVIRYSGKPNINSKITGSGSISKY